jgi:hypothetical protein
MAQIVKKHDSNIRKMMPDGSNVLFSDDDSDNEEGAEDGEAQHSDDEVDANEAQDEGPVDRYGFYLDAGKRTLALSDAEVAKRRMKEKLREVKWEKMRADWRTYSKRDGGKRKLKSRIRKVCPPSDSFIYVQSYNVYFTIGYTLLLFSLIFSFFLLVSISSFILEYFCQFEYVCIYI